MRAVKTAQAKMHDPGGDAGRIEVRKADRRLQLRQVGAVQRDGCHRVLPEIDRQQSPISDGPTVCARASDCNFAIDNLGRFRASGLAMLIAEQNIASLDLTDRVFTLDGGRMRFEGSVAELEADDSLRRTYFGLA
jgi:hypothetical protein